MARMTGMGVLARASQRYSAVRRGHLAKPGLLLLEHRLELLLGGTRHPLRGVGVWEVSGKGHPGGSGSCSKLM